MDQDAIKTGVIENFRHYIGMDYVYSKMFEIQNKTERNKTIKRMLNDYNVVRGFPNHKQDCAIDLIIKKFSVIRPDCSLSEKANKLGKLSELLKDNDYTHVNANSAISKLYWFYNSNNWMMYDRLSKQGIKHYHSASFKIAKSRLGSDFLAYYSILDDLGIPLILQEVNIKIKNSNIILNDLSAERIIDKILMYFGQPSDKSVINRHEHEYLIDLYANKLDPNFSRHVDDLTVQIHDSLSRSALFQRNTSP